MSSKTKIFDNLINIKEEVKSCCKSANRKTNSVKIMAVSKNISRSIIIEAVKTGHRIFGENRVQEALKKWPVIKDSYPKIKLHMIGPLQSNKTKQAIEVFDVIETVDREKIALEILKYKKKTKTLPDLYVQINIGEEKQKNGYLPHKSVDFIKECNLSGLNIVGVMGIAPLREPPAPYFALLKNIANEAGVKNISMGMSGDFKDAIYMGATIIRVGTMIFGNREAGILKGDNIEL